MIRWEQLAKRADAFRLIVTELQRRPGCLIVETGTIREPGNWQGDGQSTVVWDTTAADMAGQVITIDIDPAAAELVAQLGLAHTTAITADSVATLAGLDCGPVDLLYLDSLDIQWGNPQPSAAHHLAELHAADHLIEAGRTIVAVDDNMHGAGKGDLVAAEMARRNIPEWVAGYVRAWRC